MLRSSAAASILGKLWIVQDSVVITVLSVLISSDLPLLFVVGTQCHDDTLHTCILCYARHVHTAYMRMYSDLALAHTCHAGDRKHPVIIVTCTNNEQRLLLLLLLLILLFIIIIYYTSII